MTRSAKQKAIVVIALASCAVAFWTSRPWGARFGTASPTSQDIAHCERLLGFRLPPGAEALGVSVEAFVHKRVLLKLRMGAEPLALLLAAPPSGPLRLASGPRQVERRAADPGWWDPDGRASFQSAAAEAPGADAPSLRLMVVDADAGDQIVYLEWRSGAQ